MYSSKYLSATLKCIPPSSFQQLWNVLLQVPFSNSDETYWMHLHISSIQLLMLIWVECLLGKETKSKGSFQQLGGVTEMYSSKYLSATLKCTPPSTFQQLRWNILNASSHFSTPTADVEFKSNFSATPRSWAAICWMGAGRLLNKKYLLNGSCNKKSAYCRPDNRAQKCRKNICKQCYNLFPSAAFAGNVRIIFSQKDCQEMFHSGHINTMQCSFSTYSNQKYAFYSN